MSILRNAQSELRKHNLDTFTDKLHRVVTPGCPHCGKAFYTISQLVDHLADDVLPAILETAFATATKFVFCRECSAVVEYEKAMLESDGRTGLEIVCKACHSIVCTFHDTKPIEPGVTAETGKSACPKCGMLLPCDLRSFDVIDAFRCPNCDALFEQGKFVCYGAKPTPSPN
jgi:hypothetical protein